MTSLEFLKVIVYEFGLTLSRGAFADPKQYAISRYVGEKCIYGAIKLNGDSLQVIGSRTVRISLADPASLDVVADFLGNDRNFFTAGRDTANKLVLCEVRELV